MLLASSADENCDSAFDSECAFAKSKHELSVLLGPLGEVFSHAKTFSSECGRPF